MPDTTVLRFNNVSFGYKPEFPLFDRLSFTLSNANETGKIVALMGPSGVGKTTFCDLALGTRKQHGGEIVLEPAGAKVAFIPQKGVMFEELDIRENIACLKHSRSLGTSFREDRIRHAVDSLGLAQVLQNNTKTSNLSGGEAQRVMLARIQTIGCNILILDEPCSFLDNKVKDAFLDALRVTVDEYRLLALMVTHLWDEAQLIADEVIFFHQAPGRAVTLRHCSIDEARRVPPTVDAFWGIHWPEGVVLSVEECLAEGLLLRSEIPSDARYVGLLNGHEPEGHFGDDFERNTYRRIFRGNKRMTPRRNGIDHEPLMYNSDGFLLSSFASTTR